MIQVVDLHKYYQELHVLKGVNLHVKEKEVVVIIGTSDSGKSTLLRCLHDLEQPDQGEIRIFDKRRAEVQGEIAAVFQHINLFPHKTVMENVIGTLMVIHQQSEHAAILEANTLLAKVGLTSQARAFPKQLSKGQKRCVAIALALTLHPRLLLFDNPTADLDETSAAKVLQIMKELAATEMTMVIGTNEMTVARELADRIVFLENGVIVEGNPTSTFFKPSQTEKAQLNVQENDKPK